MSIFCHCAFGCPRHNRSPYRGATAKRSLGVPWLYLSYYHTPNEFGGGTRDDVRVDTVLFKML